MKEDLTEIRSYEAVLPESGFLTVKTYLLPEELTSTFYIGIRVKPGVSDIVLMLANAVSDIGYPKPEHYYYTTSAGAWVEATAGYDTTDLKIYTGLLAIPAEHTHSKDDITGVDWSSLSAEPFQIDLPAQYDAVVGDTLEIFQENILECRDDRSYYVLFEAPKGQKYRRKWVYTPAEGDSSFTLYVSVYDNMRRLLAEQSTVIAVHPAPQAPSAPFYLLCIGDSLTENGIWPVELRRRLCKEGGNPAGDGLSNIVFVGSKGSSDGCQFEGHSGYSYSDYLTEGKKFVTVSVSDGMKGEESIGSTWLDDEDHHWQLQQIVAESNQLIFQYPEDMSGYDLPQSGTLRYVSGSGSMGNILYQNAFGTSSNPFWNTETGEVDFSDYCSRIGIPRIDGCLILMGWNGTKSTDTILSQTKILLNRLHEAYPSCKVVLSGLQIPCEDGLGENYGSSGDWNSLLLNSFVHNLNRSYLNLCQDEEYSSYVSFMQLSGQFDSKYNSVLEERPVNCRNTRTEWVGINGIHPSQNGYLQIADAFYRKTSGFFFS